MATCSCKILSIFTSFGGHFTPAKVRLDSVEAGEAPFQKELMKALSPGLCVECRPKLRVHVLQPLQLEVPQIGGF